MNEYSRYHDQLQQHRIDSLREMVKDAYIEGCIENSRPSCFVESDWLGSNAKQLLDEDAE